MRVCSLLLSLLSVFFLGCKKPAPEPMYIGHVAPHALADRSLGERADHGILLAVEEVKDDPPITGRPVVVLNPETQGPDSYPALATRLVTVSKGVALLVDLRPTPTEQLCRIAQQREVPLVASCGLPGSALSPYSFSVGLAPAEQGKCLARYAVQDLKKKQVDLFVDSRLLISAPLSAAFSEEFLKAEKAHIERHVFGDAKELDAALQKLTKDESALRVLVGSEEDLAQMTAQETMLPRALLFAGEERIKPAPAVNVFYATAFFADGSTPRAQEFEKKYRAKFGDSPDATAALAYDAARVLFEGLRRAKTVRGEKVRDELKELKKFECLTGPLSFDKEHNTRRPVFIVQHEKEQLKLLKRYDPEEN